jgi:hypothetical protein
MSDGAHLVDIIVMMIAFVSVYKFLHLGRFLLPHGSIKVVAFCMSVE